MDEFEANMKEYSNKKIPTLQGEVTGGQVRVWCKYCRKYHIHGWDESMGFITHRVAHCIKTVSPYDETGYDIRVDKG